jgi:hypothetical protein
MLGEEAFAFVSSQYLYPIKIARGPSPEELDAASRSSLDQLQPYRYPSGLPEIPMMAVSDVWAFRHLDLDRKEYLRTLLAAVDYAYERHSVVSLLFHPIVLATHDPSCEVAEALLRRALEKPGGCWVTDNDTLCREVFK